MNDKLRDALFDIVRDRLSPSELRNLVDQVLGAGAFDDLDVESYPDRYDAFLKQVEQGEKENSLLEQIAKARPDIDLTIFNIAPISEEKRKDSKHTKFIPFTNREPELKKVVDKPNAQYHVFDAPVGYGKTALLDKLKKEFDNLGWFCVYISSKDQRTISQVISHLVDVLGIDSPTCKDDTHQSGIEIGKAVAERRTQEPGLALLFDIDRTLEDPFKPVLKALIENLIPGIWDGLIQNSDFFEITSQSYRVVIAGRYLAKIVIKLDLFYQIIRLPPFDYHIAQDMCTRYVEKVLVKDKTERDEFAAHLLFHSGGHPGCIAHTLRILEQPGVSPANLFTSHRKQIEEIVCNEANSVRQCIDRDWRRIFDVLCIYRRFDQLLLNRFLDADSTPCVLIVTVTKVEVQAVLDVFSKAAGKRWTRRFIGSKTYYNLYTHGGVPVFMVQSGMGIATPGGALSTVRQAIQDLEPQAIIMCGIAFGLQPDKQQLGDILVAEQIQYYEPQKVDRRRGHISRGDRVTSDALPLDRFRSGDLEWQGAPTHFGLVLSGEKLVNDPAFQNMLLEAEPEAVGGEMEGAGLYAAARDAKVDWILVKAICDWADGEKNDDAHPLAARNAAQFVLHVLQLGGWSGIEQVERLHTDSIRQGMVDGAYDLAIKLKQSYLIDWAIEGSRHFSDNTTRRILVRRLQEDAPDDFRAACNRAKQFYLERLESLDGSSHFWALEVLFEYLQANVGEIGDLKQRRAMRQQFLDVELPAVLNSLVTNRDPRSEYELFKPVLERDWELQFVANYYLRDVAYDDSVYQEILGRVEQFFASASGRA